MTFQTTLPPGYGTGGTYPAQFDRLVNAANAVTAGVTSIPSATTGDLAVTAGSTNSGSVIIAAGGCWVSAGTGQGFYYAYNDAPLTAVFENNSSGSARTDLVVIQIIDNGVAAPYVNGSAGGTITAPMVAGYPYVVKNWTPGNAYPTNSVVLAQVVIPNGYNSATPATYNVGAITDVRPKAQMPTLAVANVSNNTVVNTVNQAVKGSFIYDTSVNLPKVYNGTSWDSVQLNTGSGFTNTNMASGYTMTYSSLSTSAPPNLYNGLLWYQTDTDRLLEYDGTNWVRIAWNSTAGRTGFLLNGSWTSTNGAMAQVSFTTKTFDSDAFTSGSSPYNIGTVPAGLGGLYQVSFNLTHNSSSFASLSMALLINDGTNNLAVVNQPTLSSGWLNLGGSVYPHGVSWVGPIAAGGNVKVFVYQNSGSTYTFNPVQLSCFRIGT